MLLNRPERLAKYRWSTVPACAVIEARVSQGPTCSCEGNATICACLQGDVRALQTLDALIRASGFVYKRPKY